MTPEQVASAFTAKRVGPARWQARCPAHSDKSPSLSIGGRDGKTLIHCFGGCDVADVLGAVGLSVADLFPEPLPMDRAFQYTPGVRWINPKEILGAMRIEAAVLAVISADMLNGKPVDRKRLLKAHERIQNAMEAM
jgi:hypothetical protein